MTEAEIERPGLWRQSARDVLRPDDAAAIMEKAGRIAGSMKLALFFRIAA